MRVAVISAVYNEEKNIALLLESLLSQTRRPDEILIVDDGSSDLTGAIVRTYAERHPEIRYLAQTNRGPACARNVAWRVTHADICVFTDGDCVPQKNWLEIILSGFSVPEVGAVCGTYKTLNPEHILARFIGLEIAWKYRNVRGEVDVHGSYNLAVRRAVLEEMGGYNEHYSVPSGEDWDLTYRISRQYKILFLPEAVVAHPHPGQLFPYLKLQVRRGYDRIQLYNDHPDKRKGDTYTGRIVKLQVAAAGLFLPALAWAWPCSGKACMIPWALFLFLFGSSLLPFGYFFERDKGVAFFSVAVQMARYFAWALGALIGVCKFGISLKSHAKAA